MATLVIDRFVEDEIRAQRKASGGDRYDEVWEGTYVMAPLANLEHQHLAMRLAAILDELFGRTGQAQVFAGANVSDREKGWDKNFRCPDVVVAFHGGRARHCGTHWCGGPDFLTEIISRDDKSRDKFEFYARIGVRELLLVDRDPWALELYQLQGSELKLAGASTLADPVILSSPVLGVSLRLVPGEVRPQIEITHTPSNKTCLA